MQLAFSSGRSSKLSPCCCCLHTATHMNILQHVRLPEAEHTRILKFVNLDTVQWQQLTVIMKNTDILFHEADISIHQAIPHGVCCPRKQIIPMDTFPM